mmetsp:Transcript_15413/g.18547  ORF Transcript_15413/g.18547 Transcript_15413/m.18547 type:complete len:298 (-) Transcript_15413:179-1072(-)
MRVAIVTRTKDRGTLLSRARQSVAEQSYPDIVWSVVNDGGSKVEPELEASLARDAEVETVLTHLDQSKGRAGAANVGVRAVASDLVILLDDDDRLLPDAVSTLVDALKNQPNDVAVGGQVWLVNESLQDGRWQETSRKISNPEPGPIKIVDLAYRNILPVNACLYRRSAFDAIAGYDESLPVMEDWDFLLRIVQLGDIGKCNIPVAEYYLRPEMEDDSVSISNSVGAGHHEHIEWDARLRNRYLRQDLLEGKFGMGHLMNPPHRLPMERINYVVSSINETASRSWFARKILSWVRKR